MSHFEEVLLLAGDGMKRIIARLKRYELDVVVYDDILEWCAHLRVSRNLSINTIENYSLAVAEFMKWLNSDGVVDVDTVTVTTAEAWLQHLYVIERSSGKTRGLKLTALRQFYRWRLVAGRADKNPLDGMGGPKPEKLLPKKYTESQLRQIFGSCDLDSTLGIRDYSILMFFYATGARRHEVEALSLSQLTIRGKSGRVEFKGKGRKERIVEFGSSCCEALALWLHEREKIAVIDDSEPVWVGVQGRCLGMRLMRTGIFDVMSRAIKKTNLKIDGARGVHRLRVSFATDLYDNDVDILTIQQLLGHEKVETTRGYIAVSEKRLRTKMPEKQINKILSKQAKIPLWAQLKQRAGESDAPA